MASYKVMFESKNGQKRTTFIQASSESEARNKMKMKPECKKIIAIIKS